MKKITKIVMAIAISQGLAYTAVAGNAAGSDKNNVTSSIKTCNVATPNAVNCSQELIINGPVMTDYLELHRTANSDVDLDNNVNTLARPAELFNFRPDAYIWAYNLGLGRASIQTTYLREMAPRY